MAHKVLCKEAITEYHNLERGRSQKGIYLRDPTPKQGELFKKNGWSEWQTKTKIIATSVEILEFRSNPMTEPRTTQVRLLVTRFHGVVLLRIESESLGKSITEVHYLLKRR